MANILATGISSREHLQVFDELIAERLSNLEIEKVLIYLIDTVDAGALFNLANQFDVLGFKGWRLATTELERRELLKKAIELHRLKGTPFAIREAAKAVGFFNIHILEGGGVLHNSTVNYDSSVTYGGADWAVFRVIVDLGNVKGISAATVDALVALINEYKNVRSVLLEVRFTATLREEMINVTDQDVLKIEVGGLTDDVRTELLYDATYNHDGSRQYDGSFDDLVINIIHA